MPQKWAKDARHEAYINVVEIKGVTRPITGAASSWTCTLLPTQSPAASMPGSQSSGMGAKTTPHTTHSS
jgi:hypothetical protein